MYKRSARVLFVGTGNSCRSQMAEGWANHLGSGRLVARSAGIEAHGIDPHAVAVMREVGIDISPQSSTRLMPAMLAWADLVITVCGYADEHCPELPTGVQKKYWPLDHPARTGRDEVQIMQDLRTMRDAIHSRVKGMIGGMKMLERVDSEGV